MSFDPISSVLDIGAKLIDKLIPDPSQKAAAQLELVKLQQSGDLAEMVAQTDINKIEASSASLFVSGWRPFIGWVCGLALAYSAIVEPIARFVAVMCSYTGHFPTIDTTITMQIMFGMLGLGGMRTFEKSRGIASK